MSEEKYRCPPYFTTKFTGLSIREYLSYVGRGYPYEFYVCFKKVKPSTSYSSIVRYFWILKKIGLIREVGEEKGNAPIPRKLYEIAIYEDPRWYAPQEALYPETRLGKKRYKYYKMIRESEEARYAPMVEEIKQYINLEEIPSDLRPYIYEILKELSRIGEAYEGVYKLALYMFKSGKLYEAPKIFDVLEIIDSIMNSNYTELLRELLSAPSLKYLEEHGYDIVDKYRG